MQVMVQIETAKTRDRLFIEEQIGENDIEQAVERLRLEMDPEFAKMSKDH